MREISGQGWETLIHVLHLNIMMQVKFVERVCLSSQEVCPIKRSDWSVIYLRTVQLFVLA